METNQFTCIKSIVERRSEGNRFNSIGEVFAQSTLDIHQYSFCDVNPLAGNNLYRIKMIDQDGNFTYSNTVVIKMNDAIINLNAYPNPANNKTTLLFKTSSSGKYIIKITDLKGKVIELINGISSIGINRVSIDLSSFAKGTYFIILSNDKNGRQILKLSKQ